VNGIDVTLEMSLDLSCIVAIGTFSIEIFVRGVFSFQGVCRLSFLLSHIPDHSSAECIKIAYTQENEKKKLSAILQL
jgi:hypothetical protein